MASSGKARKKRRKRERSKCHCGVLCRLGLLMLSILYMTTSKATVESQFEAMGQQLANLAVDLLGVWYYHRGGA